MYTPSSWQRTTLSMIEPSSLYVVDLTLPRRITNDTSFVGCLRIGISVTSSIDSTYGDTIHQGIDESYNSFANEANFAPASLSNQVDPHLLSSYNNYLFIAGFPHLILRHNESISSGPVGSYAPSFISNITEPDSNARTVCHWPAGIFKATTCPLGHNSIVSVQILSSSS